MFLSGGGRQPLSASPVLLLAVLYFTVANLGPCVKIYLSAFEVSITGTPVAFAV